MCGLGKPNATNRSRADVVPVPPNQGVPGRAASGPKLPFAQATVNDCNGPFFVLETELRYEWITTVFVFSVAQQP